MILQSIEIQGFKSFADKTVLKFGKGITAVVGPNGSGKSNISDAVRWVLGEQSTKTLRGHKMEDVIFDGTAARRPQGFAEVTLTIDNTDRSLNFDNDTVAITRRYYRSGESEYQINKATVLLKNINELFMDTGLGRDGYSMIGQGKIDAIVSTKSTERRDIFEEAAGISRYRYRKQEAQRRLEKAEDNLLRLRDIMAELESRVGPLAEQSKKAEEFLLYSEEKKNVEIGLWLHTLSQAGDLLRAQEDKIALAESQYADLERELRRMDAETASMTEAGNDLAVRMDEARRQIAALEAEAAQKDGEANLLENNMLHNNETVGRVKAELEGLTTSDAADVAAVAAKEAEIAAKEVALVETRKKLEEQNTQLQNLMSSSEGYSRQIEELALKLNTMASAISDHRVAKVTAESSVSEIESRRETVGQQMEQAKAQLEKLEEEAKALCADRVQAEETITGFQNTISGYQMRLKSRQVDAETLRSRLEQIRLDAGEKERRAGILRELEQNMEGFSGAVKAVMQAAGSGSLRGIHGPVSRLLSVEKQYATAVEIALGSRMQNIIVDSEGDAKRAIQLLKQQRAGRATFLPIPNIQPRLLRESGFQDMDGFVAVASDLVQCDEKYRNIFDNLLGLTVVAEDLDTATLIAKTYRYHFQVVTLDGQVVNAGGSLTGGSLGKNAGLLSRASEIQHLEQEAAALRDKLNAENEAFRQATEALAVVEADLVNTQSELTTASEDLVRIRGEERRISQQQAAAELSVAQLTQEADSAEARIAQLRSTAQAESAEMERLEAQAAAAQSKMEEATGGRDTLAGQREILSTAVTNRKLEISLLEKDQETAKLAIAQLKTNAGGRARQAEALRAEIVRLQESNAQLALDVEKTRAAAADLRLRAKETEQTISDLSAQRVQAEKQQTDLRQQEKESLENKEKLSGEIARLTERKAAMLKEHDDIIAKLFDEYGMTRTEAEASGISVEDPQLAKRRLDELKSKIKRLGTVNVAAIEEYKEVGARYEFMSGQIADVEQAREELHKLIHDLTGQMKQKFLEGFTQVAKNFSSTFVDLFGGGKAELQLSDPDNVLESGIEIIAQPPGKKVSSIELMSGGEKALIALSIYFAIMKVNPPPFCLLDEVESALDDVNVDRFAEYLVRMGDRTQFICITHRRGTMEEADMLYGVTMQEKGVSRLLELNVSQLAKTLAIPQ